MADLFRFPFKRAANFLGSYRVDRGANSLPVVEDMLLEAGDPGGVLDLSGAATATLTASAVLVGDAQLGGGAAVSFGASGQAEGQASLGGAALVALSAAGSLDAQAGLGGSAAITFATSAGMAAQADIFGQAAIVFSISSEPAGQVVPEARGSYWQVGQKPNRSRTTTKDKREEILAIVKRAFADDGEEAAELIEAVENFVEPQRNGRLAVDWSGIEADLDAVLRAIADYREALARQEADDDEEAEFILMAA